MRTFVNRKEELAYLNSEYKKEDSSLVVIYGRRRTRKTTLITENFAKSPFLQVWDG